MTSGNLTDGIPLVQCLPPGGATQEGAWICPVCNQTNPPHIWKRCKMCGTLKVQERRAAVGANEQKHQIVNNSTATTSTTSLDGSGSGTQYHVGLVVDAQVLEFFERERLSFFVPSFFLLFFVLSVRPVSSGPIRTSTKLEY